MIGSGQKSTTRLHTYIVVLFLLTLFVRMVLSTYYNSSFGGIEQNVVYGIQRILQGQALYQNPAAGNYAIMQYTPLWYYCTAAIAKCLHIQVINVQHIYMLCRTLALLCNLLTVFIATLIIRSWQFSWLRSLVFAMPVLMIPTYHYYTRVDSLHLLLFAAAMCAYIYYSKRGNLLHLLLVAVFTGGCIMAKQSGVIAVGIVGCCLLFYDRKYLVALGYCFGTFCTAYLVAVVCTQGQWFVFYQNTFLGLKNGIDLSFLSSMFISQFFLDIVPCYALGCIIAWLAMKKIQDKTYRIIAAGAVLSFLFAAITGLKEGSSNNYFTEFLFFIIIAVPYLLQNQNTKAILAKPFGYTITIKGFTSFAFFILITSKTVGIFSAVFIEKNIKNHKAEYVNEQGLYSYVTRQLGIQKGEYIFFTDRMFLDNLFFEYTLMPTKDVVSQVYRASHNTYDYSAFIKGMNTGLVKYIITTENKKDINEWNSTISFIFFDKSKFRLLTRYMGYSIYVYTPA